MGRNGAARARARATRRGYNPRTRRILHVRKCWQALSAAMQRHVIAGRRKEGARVRATAQCRMSRYVAIMKKLRLLKNE